MSVTALDATDPDPMRSSASNVARRWRVVAELPAAPAVDIVIPVHNQEGDLASSVGRLHAYLRHEFPFSARITIADGASTDGTLKIAARLAADFPDVRLLRINEIGRGRALACAWLTSSASVVAYIDCGSTDLSSLLPVVAPIISGHSDVSIGSSAARPGDSTGRGAIGRSSGVLVRLMFGVGLRGAQSAIKALRADVARRLLPTVGNRDWFFDVELLSRARHAGLRIYELPA